MARHFHAKDCESDRGDFRQFPHDQNQERYRALTTMLAASGLGGFGIAIDLAAQRRVNPHALETFAYYKCLLEVVQKMRNCAAYNNETVKFTFDTRHESEYNTGLLYGMAKDAKDWKPFIDAEIDFACSRTNPRIQVADLFTRETMKALDNHIGPVKRPMRKSWQCLKETNRFHMEAFGEEWFRDLMAHMSDLERKTNMSMSDYAQWLETKGKDADGISNRFEYMKYAIERDGE